MNFNSYINFNSFKKKLMKFNDIVIITFNFLSIIF